MDAKAKVEAGVLLAERWIIARLRHRRFTTVSECNLVIRELVGILNARPFKKLDGSRQTMFEGIDKPALRPLPATRYEFAIWKPAKVNIDYHLEADHHYYSVPYRLVGEVLDVRLSQSTVEVFRRGKRVASHVRSFVRWHHSTDPAHMPESHRRYAEWSPGRIIAWAEKTGPSTAELAEQIMARRPHPEQGFRSCLGIVRLAKRYGDARLEAACTRALAVRSYSYRSVESILSNGLDNKPLPASQPLRAHPRHDNVRGPDYYS